MADMGRPPIEIDQREFEKLCNMLCTCEEIAGWFGCSTDTIYRWCLETYKQTFQEAFATHSAKGKISIRRQQFALANDGNATMLIWLGKQVLGQKEQSKVETDMKLDASVAAEVKVSRIDMAERVKQLKGETE